MKRKICFAITSITDNGVTRVISILLDQIDYSQYDVSVLLTRKVPRKRALNEKARIIEVSRDRDNGLFGKIQNIRELNRILKAENFDVIIALGDYAAMYVLLGCYGISAKKIVSERNDPNREPDKKVFRILRDLVYKRADSIVCQTNDAAAYFADIVQNRVVIYNPISDNLPVYQCKERQKTIVNFCRIDTQKNLPLLIDAFSDFSKEHAEYEMVIYGDGPQKKAIEDYIQQSGVADKIQLQDFCLNIHEKVMTASMFVSSSDFEGMSNSMLEAMGMGMPVICTDCPIGGAHEVIHSGENGILVPCNDKAALVAAMKAVAENPDYAQSLGQNALKINQLLDKETISRQWWALLENL